MNRIRMSKRSKQLWGTFKLESATSKIQSERLLDNSELYGF